MTGIEEPKNKPALLQSQTERVKTENIEKNEKKLVDLTMLGEIKGMFLLDVLSHFSTIEA